MHCTSFSELDGFVFIRQTVSFSSQFTDGTSAIFSSRIFPNLILDPGSLMDEACMPMMMTEKGRVG